jgi:hypothetical protein
LAFSSSFLVGFDPVYPFIGFAKRADIALDILYKVIDNSLLVVTSVKANRTKLAYFRQSYIQGRRF